MKKLTKQEAKRWLLKYLFIHKNPPKCVDCKVFEFDICGITQRYECKVK